MEVDFSVIVGNLNDIGFYELFLPYVLFTTLVYALFRKIKLFEEGQMIDTLLSMTVGFFVINYTSLGPYLCHLFTVSSVFIALALMIILITATLGVDLPKYMAEHEGTAIMLAALISIFLILETKMASFVKHMDPMLFKIIMFLAISITFVAMAARIHEK
ncbi:MAG: hypothetical protein U9P44_02105 [archaeon]|nr:hypothetical protein [archaeon]